MSDKNGSKKRQGRKKSEGSRSKGDASVVNTVSREVSGGSNGDYNLRKNEDVLNAFSMRNIAGLAIVGATNVNEVFSDPNAKIEKRNFKEIPRPTLTNSFIPPDGANAYEVFKLKNKLESENQRVIEKYKADKRAHEEKVLKERLELNKVAITRMTEKNNGFSKTQNATLLEVGTEALTKGLNPIFVILEYVHKIILGATRDRAEYIWKDWLNLQIRIGDDPSVAVKCLIALKYKWELATGRSISGVDVISRLINALDRDCLQYRIFRIEALKQLDILMSNDVEIEVDIGSMLGTRVPEKIDLDDFEDDLDFRVVVTGVDVPVSVSHDTSRF